MLDVAGAVEDLTALLKESAQMHGDDAPITRASREMLGKAHYYASYLLKTNGSRAARVAKSSTAVTPDALAPVFQRIDETKRVVGLEKQPPSHDFFDPFLKPAAGILLANMIALFGLRFTSC